MKRSGIFALSEPGPARGDAEFTGLIAGGRTVEIDCPITFAGPDVAVRAFIGAGPMALAIRQSGERTVHQGVRGALGSFVLNDGRVTLPLVVPRRARPPDQQVENGTLL